ncbi:MAG TPA: ribosome-recycling factor [Candidatus Limnocylindrales bacterium]|nr:ribosome-recycling factor [Candidatus Limnocylindrales bacterium]
MASEDLAVAQQKMTRVVEALERDLRRVQTGAASGSLLNEVFVDHHGRRRLIDMATITIPDPRQIVVQPWDPASLRAIGTAISQSRIGLTPTVDGPSIRLYVPGLSEERRRELAGIVHRRVEQAHVEVRSVRHETLAAIRKREKARVISADDGRHETAQLRRLTDQAIDAVDARGEAKVAELLHLEGIGPP